METGTGYAENKAGHGGDSLCDSALMFDSGIFREALASAESAPELGSLRKCSVHDEQMLDYLLGSSDSLRPLEGRDFPLALPFSST